MICEFHKACDCMNHKIIDEINDHEERLQDLERKISSLTVWSDAHILNHDYCSRDSVTSNEVGKKPYKCPVCDGSGGIKHPLTALLFGDN